VKKAFTLVEVIIVFFLLSILSGSLSYGFLRYSRGAALKNAQDRIERLLAQADFLSTVLQQEAEVLIIKDNAHWYALIKPWADEEIDALDIFRNLSRNFVELDGTEKVLLNDAEVTELSLVFLPMKGIDPSYVRAKDSMDNPRSLRELGLDPRMQKIRSMQLILKGKNSNRSIELLPYARLTTHMPIPQEYIDLDV
jgi:hypothetical protein